MRRRVLIRRPPPLLAIMVAALAGFTSTACGREARVCGVMRLVGSQEQYTVVRTYPSWGFFSDKCTVQTPEEMLDSGKGYVVPMYLMANADPKAFIGVKATNGGQYDVDGDRWVKL